MSLKTDDEGHAINDMLPGYMDTALNDVPSLDAQKKIWIEQDLIQTFFWASTARTWLSAAFM